MLPTLPSLRQPEYKIPYSLRFRSSASAYLSRTPSVTSSRTTWTWSGWLKRGSLSGTFGIFGAGTDNSANRSLFWFNSSDQIVYQEGNTNLRTTAAVFRDPSAWGHLVVVVDNGNAVASNRILIYWNGILQTTTGTGDPGSTQMNVTGVAMKIGTRTNPPTTNYFDGYMAEVNFIDGQALTPAAFGAISSKTGVWSPRKYTGTYGTNGFYLKFNDNSAATSAAIGKDSSGNSNNWTPTNISLVAGSTFDSMTDTPTPYADAVDFNAVAPRGNYATLNPLIKSNTGAAFANANLRGGSTVAGGNTRFAGTHIISSGKWYWEAQVDGQAGIFKMPMLAIDSNGSLGSASNEYSYRTDGNKANAGTLTAYGSTFTSADIIGIALDLDAGTLTFYKNNITQGVAFSSLSGDFCPGFAGGASGGNAVPNFGQCSFAYTPPTGFNTLCTQNLPDPAIVHGHAYMTATTYTGTGVGRNISNLGNNRSFRPDLVWIKSRSNTTDNALYDSVRGAQQDLVSNSTAAETTQSTGLTAFNEDGFGLSTLTKLNSAGNTYVAWQWKAGDSAVTNTAGSITSQVDVNTTAGFSIVTYTGTGTSNPTIGHGLGVVPAMIIAKDRDTNTTSNEWWTYHQGVGAGYYIFLNTAAARATISSTSNGAIGTSPSSTTFTIQAGSTNSNNLNETGDRYVAYCFAEVNGYSKFGSYTGNNSIDGPFVYCGFRPKWIMVKRVSPGTSNWQVWDTSRLTYNVAGTVLVPNNPDKDTPSSDIDITSNGFKLRTAAVALNAPSDTYIFAAFAEGPFKYALAR